MYTTYIYSQENYEFLKPYECFKNHYLVNSDGSIVECNQVNGSGIYRDTFMSNRPDFQNNENERLSLQKISDIQFEMRGAITNFIFNKANEEIYIIPDPMGLSILFHYLTPKVSVITTNLAEMKKILSKMNIVLEKDEKFLMEVLSFGNGGLTSTPYKDVLSLNPYEFIYCNHNGYRIIKNRNLDDFIDSIENVSIEETIQQLENDIKRNLNIVSQYPANGKFISHLTGGFDSRLILSGILNQGLEDKFLFFCSGKDGTPDVDISKNLCRHYGLTFTEYSGYVLNKTPEKSSDPAQWALENTSGLSYSAHNHYDRNDNIVISGGLGGQVMSSNTIKNNPNTFDTFKELMSKIWPNTNTDSTRAIFQSKYVNELNKNYLSRISEGKKLGLQADALPDYFYQTIRARFYTGQISFYMSNSNPRFDALYSPKASLMGLKQDLITRQSNLIGISVMESLKPGLVNLPFYATKINEEYITLRGEISVEKFKGNKLKSFNNFPRTSVKYVKKDKENLNEFIKRANKLRATYWQVEQEQDAKDDLRKTLQNIPEYILNDYLNMNYINSLLNQEITDRVNLRKLHNLRNNLMWYYN